MRVPLAAQPVLRLIGSASSSGHLAGSTSAAWSRIGMAAMELPTRCGGEGATCGPNTPCCRPLTCQQVGWGTYRCG